MTSSIGLSAVFGNTVVLLALVAAIASPRMSQLARLVISTLAFTLAWFTTTAVGETGAPDWTMFMGGAVIVVSTLVVIATLHRWTQAGDGGENQPEHRADDGGGGPRRHQPAPPRGGGGSEPSWWPEFERRLALYTRERERERRRPCVVPAEPAPHGGRPGSD